MVPVIVRLASNFIAGYGVLSDAEKYQVMASFLARNQPGFANYRQKPGIDVDSFYRGVNPQWTGSMPETIFYGRDGRILGHFIGQQPRAAFEEGIHQVLASAGGH